MCMYKAPKNETELVFGVFSHALFPAVTQCFLFPPGTM